MKEERKRYSHSKKTQTVARMHDFVRKKIVKLKILFYYIHKRDMYDISKL